MAALHTEGPHGSPGTGGWVPWEQHPAPWELLVVHRHPGLHGKRLPEALPTAADSRRPRSFPAGPIPPPQDSTWDGAVLRFPPLPPRTQRHSSASQSPAAQLRGHRHRQRAGTHHRASPVRAIDSFSSTQGSVRFHFPVTASVSKLQLLRILKPYQEGSHFHSRLCCNHRPFHLTPDAQSPARGASGQRVQRRWRQVGPAPGL